MKIGRYYVGLKYLKARFFKILGYFWHVPFGYYASPIAVSGRVPHPIKPRCLQDIILRNMMVPDNITRAITADKIAARGWAAEKIGEQYIAPLYDICDSVDMLATRNYPYPYVVKTNHASAQMCFVYDDDTRAKMLETARTWDLSPHNPKREWTYHDIEPKFMVEQMLVADDQPHVIDIKLFCFYGQTFVMQYIHDRDDMNAKSFVSPEWKALDVYLKDLPKRSLPPKPDYLDELLQLGSVLGEEFDFCRVDFMVLSEKIYFGELTSSPLAGAIHFKPLSYDKALLQEYERIRREKIAAKRLAYSAMVVTESAPDFSE